MTHVASFDGPAAWKKETIMAILMGDLRAALVAAGAPEDLATKAASEAATYEVRIASIESRLSVLQWMSGATLALLLTLLFKVFHG